MSKTYFHLFACCLPVKGAVRSIVCDLQRDRYELIPNSLFEILTEHAGKPVDTVKAFYENEFDDVIDEYFDFLTTKEFGLFTDSLSGFQPIGLDYREPRVLTNAIVDFDPGSAHDLPGIVRQLSAELCDSMELRFFYRLSLADLESLIKQSFDDCSLRSAEIIVGDDGSSYTVENIERFLDRFQRIKRITVHSSGRDQFARTDHALILFTSEEIGSELCCGVVSPFYFISNIEMFIESRSHNNCLNRKIGIDKAGNIKNCPSMAEGYGNIRDTPLREVLNKADFRKKWNITKDEIDTCRDCEFRYICQDCRAYTADSNNIYSKPLKCNYDPYEANWL
jgi:SPASM domain peptide maturase of grasp-with-spasm system